MAYPEISPDDKVREPFTGVEVGFSSIDLESTESWAFIDDVVGALARNTLGPRIHLGGGGPPGDRRGCLGLTPRLGAVLRIHPCARPSLVSPGPHLPPVV